jgi:hypothetical protein
MILKKYNHFLDLSVINENMDKAKKFMKDKFILDTAVKSLGIDNIGLDPKVAYDFDEKMKNGLKRSYTPSDLASISAENKKALTDKMKELKIGEDKVAELISVPSFDEIKKVNASVTAADGKFKKYVLFNDDPAWLYNFVYFYYYENMSIDDLNGLYARLLINKDMLKNLQIVNNGKLETRPFDLNYINIRIPNNSELLDDALGKIPRYRIYKKFESDLPSHLKRDLKGKPQIIKDKFTKVAEDWDSLYKDGSGNPLTDKEELEKADKQFKNFWGKMDLDTREGSPTKGKVVFQSKVARYANIGDLIEVAESQYKALGNTKFESFIELFDDCNDQFGNSGATQLFLMNGIMIIEVKSFGANKILNAHTSHCIKDSLSYWNQYVTEDNKQYYIYNFNLTPQDQLFTIGVTIEPKDNGRGYLRAAHDKIDRGVNPVNILGDWEKEYDLTEAATKKAKELDATNEDIEKYGALYSILRPLSSEEYKRRELVKIANMEIVKPGLSIDRIKELVRVNGADINRNEGVALLNAVQEDDLEKVTAILDLGGSAKLRTGKQSVINSAKSLEIIKLLVDRGSNITVEVYNNVCDDIDSVRFLLDSDIDPNFENSLPVRRACQGSWKSKAEPGESYLDTFKLLVEYDVKLDDHRGKFMILKWAAEYGRLDIIEEVVKLGADHGYVGAYSWMAHCEKIDKSKSKELINRLIELCEQFEPELWNALNNVFDKGKNKYVSKWWHLNI